MALIRLAPGFIFSNGKRGAGKLFPAIAGTELPLYPSTGHPFCTQTMKLRLHILRSILLLFALFPVSLLADRIVLRNGAILNGQIINQNQGSVVIRTRQGVQTISKATIARIQYGDFPDPEEERQKEEERRKEAERKRQEELRQQEIRRQQEQQRREEAERQRNENQEEEPQDQSRPDAGFFSWLPEFSFSRVLWDPDLGLHRMRAGLSVGTVNNDWLGVSPIRMFRQVDSLFGNSQVFSQAKLETRNGWHSTADLEYGINRYFVALQFSVSRQNGEANVFRAGAQRDLFIDSVLTTFGNLTEPGVLSNDRMRWEEGRLLLGYQILYGDGPELDFFAGFNRSLSLADLDYAGLTSFDQNPDQQYRLYIVRSFANMKGWEAGLRGTIELPSKWVPDNYQTYLPVVEWEGAYLSMKGTHHFSYIPVGFSLLYGARGRTGASTIDFEGTGGRGQIGFKFELPSDFSLHVGGYGSTVLLKTHKLYNENDDADIQSALRAQIFPIFLGGLFTTKEVHRGTYLRIQWERRF